MVMSFYNKDYDSFSKFDFSEFILIHSDSNQKDRKIKIIKKKYFIKDEKSFEIKNTKSKSSKKYFTNEVEQNLFENKLDFFTIYISIDDKKEEFLLALPLLYSEKDMVGYDDIRRRHYIQERSIHRKRFIDDREYFLDLDRFDRFGSHNLIMNSYMRNSKVLDEYADLFNFFMVKTQRLIYLPSEDDSKNKNFSRYMIERYAKDLSQKIATSLAESNEKTASHDKSFPERLIQNINTLPLSSYIESETNIREKYKETQDKITKILNAGLLFREKNISLPDDGLNNENVKTVLSLYLQDLNEKLAVYDDLLNKIEAFQDIVGNKLNNKDFHVQYEKGFYFTSKYGEQKELKLSELSSGEQHQIVLFYELIFLAETGTYYLIDEPEISLHVDWQRSFLDDIARVEKLRGHKFLVATHSPQIIGSKRNLCIALDGGIL